MANLSTDDWRILFVDDDEDDYLITQNMLSQAKGRKITVDWAPSFEAGQQRLAANQYHAVLVDYDLPPRTGIELIRETVARGYPAPLIVFTGQGSYEADVEAMKAGASLYLTKADVNPLSLERFIGYAIERKRIEQELDHRLQERSIILDSIQDGLLGINRDWQITYINQQAARNSGFEPEELSGRNIWEAFPRMQGTPLEEHYRRTMLERTPVQFEMHGTLTSQWYNITLYPSAEGISVYWQDITERKLAEDALRESEQKFSLLFENAAFAAALSSMPDGALVDVNDAWVKLFGFTQSEALGKTTLALQINLDTQAREQILAQLQACGSARDQEMSLHTKSGETRILSVNIDLIEIGGQKYILNVAQDITERKQAEAALVAAKEEAERNLAQLQTVIHTMSEGLIVTDADGNILLINDAMLALSGMQSVPKEHYRAYAATRLEVRDPQGTLLTPDELPLARVLRGEIVHNLELQIQRQDTGKNYTALYSAAPVLDQNGRLLFATLTVRDITEHNQVEKQVVFQAGLLAQVHDAVIATDENWHAIYWNKMAEEVFGWSEVEIAGRNVPELLQSQFPNSSREQAVKQLLETGFFEGEVIYQRKDGTHITALASTAILRGPHGEQIGFVSTILDITARKQAEQLLEAALSEVVNEKNRLLAVMEALPVGLAILDEKGRHVQSNRAYEDLWGKPRPMPNSIHDYSDYQAWWLDSGQPVQPEEWASARVVQKGETVIGQLLEIQRFDGTHAIVVNSGAPVRDAQGRITGSAVAIMDITEQKRMEIKQQEHLLQMELQRRLMEYREQERQQIARDLHDRPVQDLCALLFNIQSTKDGITDPAVLDAIDQLTLGLKDTIQNLRETINEIRMPSLFHFGLAKVLQYQLEKFGEKYPQIKLRTSLMDDGGRLSEQMRLNLFRIFQEALNNTTRHASPTQISVQLACTDHQLVLEIQDNGKGFSISGNLLDYSDAGHYGLVGMKERAEAIGGRLEIQSEPEKGTTLRVILPIEK